MKKPKIDHMPGNAAGRRRLKRYLMRQVVIDVESIHDCMVVHLPKGFKYDVDLATSLIFKHKKNFTDKMLRALVLDEPAVGPIWEDLKLGNLAPNPYNPRPVENFFIQAAASEAMVVSGRQRLRAYAEMDAEVTHRMGGALSLGEVGPDEPVICECGRDLSEAPAADCPVPYVHGYDVYK